jgi:hypothetical protein
MQPSNLQFYVTNLHLQLITILFNYNYYYDYGATNLQFIKFSILSCWLIFWVFSSKKIPLYLINCKSNHNLVTYMWCIYILMYNKMFWNIFKVD